MDLRTGLLLKDFFIKKENISTSEKIYLSKNLYKICKCLNFELIILFLYYKSKLIHNILYNNDEFFFFVNSNIIYTFNIYFYLGVLIGENKHFIDYLYEIDLIKNINEQKRKENNELRKLIISIIILKLIKNLKECDEIFISSDKIEILKSIELENMNIIKNNIQILKSYCPNLDVNKNFEEQNIEDLYKDIIYYLIINKKFIEFKEISEIFSDLGLKEINLRKPVIKSIFKNIEEKYENLFIKNVDLNSKEKIDLLYLFIKYLIKNRLDIYDISFLIKIRQIIIKYIKSLMRNDNSEIPIVTENLEYIIKIFADPKYYYEKYKISKVLKLLKSISTENDLKNIDDFIYFHNILFDKLYLYIKVDKNNNLRIDYKIPNLHYDINTILEELDELKKRFKIDKYRFLTEFLKILEFLKNIKEYSAESLMEKLEKLNNKTLNKRIKLEIQKNENDNHDIICIYSYYSENERKLMEYKDEEISKKEKYDYKEGLELVLYEIKYEFNNNEDILSDVNSSVTKQISNNLNDNSSVTKQNSNNLYIISSYDDYDLNNNGPDLKHLKLNKIKLKNKIQNIKQLKDGNFLIKEANKLSLSSLKWNKVVYIEAFRFDNIIDFWEIYNNNKSQILIAFENKIEIFNIYRDENSNYKINNEPSIFIENLLTHFELEINNYIFILNITNIFQKYLEMKKITIKNDEKILYDNRNIFKYTNLKENNKLEFKNNSKNNINNEIESYFVKSENGLCFMPRSNNKEFTKLLLACNRKVDSNKKKYKLFLISFYFDGIIYSKYSITFLDTKNFEVLCFCPVLIPENNNIDYNPDDTNIKITNLFLVGGFDHEIRQGKIELFRLIEENENHNIEKLTDISFDDFGENKSCINCIIQSKVDGKFLIINEDGNLYSFYLSNIKNYLK